MAPIKFEEHLKNKIELRKIQPNADSWDKLSNRLDKNDSKKNTKGWWWLGIAASFIGVLLVVTFLNKSDEKDNLEQIIVETENVQNDKSEMELTDSNIETQVNEKENSIKLIPIQNNKSQKSNSVYESELNKKQAKVIPNSIDEAVSQINEFKSQEVVNEPLTPASVLSFEEQKVNDVVAQIKELQKNNNLVSDEEIDALLLTAQIEIKQKSLYNKATKTVDAASLLQDVEDDLDQSFRVRVFEILKSGYEDVKTAVAERNN